MALVSKTPTASVAIITAGSGVEGLQPAPIPPSWILEGAPEAWNKNLAESHDRTCWKLFWECTSGRFNWDYDIDETAFIISGEAFITTGANGERRLGPGDMVFFPAGSTCTWRVPARVTKFAVMRRPTPRPFAFAVRAWGKITRKLNGNRGLVATVWFAARFLSRGVLET